MVPHFVRVQDVAACLELEIWLRHTSGPGLRVRSRKNNNIFHCPNCFPLRATALMRRVIKLNKKFNFLQFNLKIYQ